jgi:tRNA(Ile)-lysidine synthase
MALLPEMIRRNWPTLRGPGIVAVSGGADSVALLRALADWVEPLEIVHVNHQLRGDQSDADERFVRDLANLLNLKCQCFSIDVAAQALHDGANLESTARQIRYDVLAQAAQESGANWIATGHTADDQAETVLHRLLRGAGMQGLRGIAVERELRPGVRVIRPLLAATRDDVLELLNSLGQPWREDASNRDQAFTRNRIRHELMPLLRTFNPAIVGVLDRLAVQAREIHAEVEFQAGCLLAECELPSAGRLRILQAARLISAPRHQVRGVFRLLWEREGWPQNDMTFNHWGRLVGVAFGEETAADMPGGVTVRRKGNVIQVGRRAE